MAFRVVADPKSQSPALEPVWVSGDFDMPDPAVTPDRTKCSAVAPISALFDQVGPQARAVGDLALFDAVATGDFNATRPSASAD